MQYGRHLKEARVRAGLSHRKAAKGIGIAPSTLYGWETDKRLPDADSLGRMVDLYRCPSVDALLGRAAALPPAQEG